MGAHGEHKTFTQEHTKYHLQLIYNRYLINYFFSLSAV